MAIRKETVKAQFDEAVRSVLEPGEVVQTGTAAVTGPNPLWSQGLFGLVGLLLFGVRYHFVFLTDRRVIFMKMSMMSSRPKGGLAWSDARSAASVSDVRSAATWSSFQYQRPAGGKPLRLNVARPWREEFKAIAEGLGGAVG